MAHPDRCTHACVGFDLHPSLLSFHSLPASYWACRVSTSPDGVLTPQCSVRARKGHTGRSVVCSVQGRCTHTHAGVGSGGDSILEANPGSCTWAAVRRVSCGCTRSVEARSIRRRCVRGRGFPGSVLDGDSHVSEGCC